MDAARREFGELFEKELWPKLKSMWSEKNKLAVMHIAWTAWREGRGGSTRWD